MRMKALACLSSVLAIAGCSGPPASVATQVVITPAGVLLAPGRPSQELSVLVLDQHGAVMEDAAVTWSSTAADIVQVSGAGVVTAPGPVGSAIVSATSGNASAQIAAISVVPVPGTVLVDDSEVLAGPDPVDPSQAFGVGALYTVSLAIAPPPVGSYVLATGEAQVAGRVVAVDGSLVTLETVPFEELFVEIAIDASLDLSTAPLLAEEQVSGVTTTRLPDGRWQLQGAPADGSLEPQAEFTVGGLTCKSDTTFAQLEILNFGLTFSPSLSFDVVFNSTQKKVVVRGSPTAVATFEPVVKAALQESVSCEYAVPGIRIPIPGPVGLFLGAVVPVGVGFKIEGTVPLANFGYHFDAEVGADLQLGFDCNPGCEGVAALDPHVSGHHRPILPGSLLGLRVESSLFGYVFAGLEAGFLYSREGRVKIAKSQTGIKLGAKLASEDAQHQDASYASEYALDLVANIGAGDDVAKFFDLISVTPVQLKLELVAPIATSPKATSITADPETFEAGDTVTFTVELDPNSTNFPIVGYNVNAVRVYNVTSGSLVLANEMTANSGQQDFEIDWVATQDGEVADSFAVFVESRLLPALRLELGKPATRQAGGTATLVYSAAHHEDYAETAPDYEQSYEEDESSSGQYTFDVVSRSAAEILFAVTSGTLSYDLEENDVEVYHNEMGIEIGCTYTKTVETTYQASGSLSVPAGTPGLYRVTFLPNDEYLIEAHPGLAWSAPYTDRFEVSGGCGVPPTDETDIGLHEVSAWWGELAGQLDPANPNVLSANLSVGPPEDSYTLSWTLTLTPP